jgi:hypothetical protein
VDVVDPRNLQLLQSIPVPDDPDAIFFDGTITEFAGLYILLSAGTSLLPETLRITRYKVWMRSVLVLWWAVLLLGMAIYTRWYVPNFFRKQSCVVHASWGYVYGLSGLSKASSRAGIRTPAPAMAITVTK